MKRTRKVVLIWVAAFLGLLGLGAGYEFVTLADPIPNNTVSHIVHLLTLQYPWLPAVFVIFMVGAWPIFWLTCAFHWWGPKERPFWWPKALWRDDPATPEDESKLNP